MMANLVVKIINFYQKVFSPDHSFWAKQRFPYGYCRFYPSCSEYTKISISKHGLAVGTMKGIARVLRCNPWSAGGYEQT